MTDVEKEVAEENQTAAESTLDDSLTDSVGPSDEGFNPLEQFLMAMTDRNPVRDAFFEAYGNSDVIQNANKRYAENIADFVKEALLAAVHHGTVCSKLTLVPEITFNEDGTFDFVGLGATYDHRVGLEDDGSDGFSVSDESFLKALESVIRDEREYHQDTLESLKEIEALCVERQSDAA